MFNIFGFSSSEVKEVVQGYNTPHIMDLEELVKEKGLPCYLVHDVGRMQVTVHHHIRVEGGAKLFVACLR